MQINTANLAALTKGYRILYDQAFQAAAPVWSTMAMATTSSNEEEFYKWLGSVPGMRKLVDVVQVKNLASHGYSIKNDEWEDTIEIPQKDIERDSYGVYNPMLSAMGAAAAQHPDELVANLYVNGFSTKCYTGKNFFDTNHEPQLGKQKFSNLGTKKLSAANFEDARYNIKSRKNAHGRPMNLGKDLALVVSPKNESLARQILQADLTQIAAGGTNVGGVTNVNKGTARALIWPQLTTAEDAWYLIDFGQVMQPFIMQFEKQPTLESLTQPNSEYVMLNHKFLYQVYARYNAGYGLPELAFGSTGADAA
jgi:phage major head subunit gpT-like protein